MNEAIDRGDVAMVKQLLNQGYHIDGPDHDCLMAHTPLHRAAQTLHTDIVATLLDAGASIDAPDSHGYTPIQYAVRRGRSKNIVELLLERGADVNHFQNYDCFGTPMHFAARTGMDIVAFLVKRGYEINSTCSNHGCSPLLLACINNSTHVVHSLLTHGANMHLRNDKGLEPLDLPETRRVLIHWQLVDIVLALAPLDLPGYVLLWICDWLPYFANESEHYKITLITNTIDSIRRRRKQ